MKWKFWERLYFFTKGLCQRVHILQVTDGTQSLYYTAILFTKFMLEEVNESMLEFVEELVMDPGHEGSTYLVWITEKKRKSKVETLALLKYLLQSQHVSNGHSVPGTWQVLSYLVLTITMVILILEENFMKDRIDILYYFRKQ